ncbi:MAG TPA: acyltransferase [Bacteroidetes bacterium]|nr:acyltransferase [Bacteroidota bacterium]
MLTLIRKARLFYYKKRQRLNFLNNLGAKTIVHYRATFNHHKNISIGNYCRIGPDCHFDGEAKIEIGDGTIFGPRVIILSSSHNYNQVKYLPYDEQDKLAQVRIGKGCWIGWGAFILPGVKIGDGAVVAMGAVVVKDVKKGEIVGGNPAKVLKVRDDCAFIDDALQNEKYYIKAVFDDNLKRESRQ